MPIEENIRVKITELVREADQLTAGSSGVARDTKQLAACEGWIVQAHNVIRLAVPVTDNPYRTRVQKIAEHHSGIIAAVASIGQILRALLPDIDRGLLGELGNKIRAEAFDDFLDHARAYLERNMKNESGAIAGVVFEDTIRRVYRDRIGDEKGKRLEDVINELTRANIITGQQNKQAKVASHVRTKATHAQWDEFDLDGVKQTIDVTRRFIADHLGG
jgi:hypothetical protein